MVEINSAYKHGAAGLKEFVRKFLRNSTVLVTQDRTTDKTYAFSGLRFYVYVT